MKVEVERYHLRMQDTNKYLVQKASLQDYESSLVERWSRSVELRVVQQCLDRFERQDTLQQCYSDRRCIGHCCMLAKIPCHTMHLVQYKQQDHPQKRSNEQRTYHSSEKKKELVTLFTGKVANIQ